MLKGIFSMRKVHNHCFLLLVIIMMMLASFPSYASSPRVSGVSRTDYMTEEQFEKILGTLRQMKDNISRGNYNFKSTGVCCASKEEADKMISCFKELFLADDEFIMYYNEKGFQTIYVERQKNAKGRYTYWLCGNGGKYREMYVVWKPHANADELLRQHDEAKKVIDTLIQQAPQTDLEKVKYYNDVIAERISYDFEGYQTGQVKYSPYYGLVEGKGVCTGYAESFFNLCYYSKIPCSAVGYATVYSVNGIPDHKTTMVNLDGRWKEVDVTWNDTDPGVQHTYFMRDLDEGWQQILGPWEHKVENL